MEKLILISGAHRSGKTLIAGILDICGVYSGTVNKTFDNVLLQENLIAPYLTMCGADPDGQSFFIPTKELYLYEKWGEMVSSLMDLQGFTNRKYWMLKNSQITLMWPLWNKTYPEAKHIIVRRDIEDIVQSCIKTSYMTGHKDAKGWEYMCKEYEVRIEEMKNSKIDYFEIWPNKFANENYQQIYDLFNWLEIPLNEDIFLWLTPKCKKMSR